MRYYLVIILSAVAAVLIASDTLSTVTEGQQLFPTDLSVTITDLAKIFMLFLTVAAGVMTVVAREHVKAAIAYGVIGYAIGVIFLIDHAPDVALVQLLVETMATVLIIIMLGRIRAGVRLRVITSLWTGRHDYNFGFLRDLGISIVIGLAVFVFSLIALKNRPQRHSIAEWHLANTKAVNTDDVVGAIVADFRGTDTLLEIAVFTTTALGVLTLLARGRRRGSSLAPLKAQVGVLHEFDHQRYWQQVAARDWMACTNRRAVLGRYTSAQWVHQQINADHGGVDRGDWQNLIIMVAAGILTVMYMIRAWQRIFQQNPLAGTVETKDEGDSLFAPLLLICVCLLLGTVLAEPMIRLISETVRQLGDPRLYISAVKLPAQGT